MSDKNILFNEELTLKEKLYLYIKKRSQLIEFNKAYKEFVDSHKLKEKLNIIYKNIIKNNCYLYKYIEKRTQKEIFDNIFYNERYNKICKNIQDQIPEYYKKRKKIKYLLKNKDYETLIKEYINIEEISNKINNISKKLINKNILIEKLANTLKDINSLIKEIEIKTTNNNKQNTSFFSKLFGKKEDTNEYSLEEFILKFKINKIKIDKKIKLLKEYYIENIEKEIINRKKLLVEMYSILEKINKDKKIIENFLNNIRDDENKFEISNKLQDLLELESLVHMNIKSIEIDINNLKNYISIIRKLSIVTINALNTGALLFANKKTTLKEIFNNPEMEKYLENIEEAKLLTHTSI